MLLIGRRHGPELYRGVFAIAWSPERFAVYDNDLCELYERLLAFHVRLER